jgi:hypothetical protein
MERINYANTWQPFFEEAGLRTFDDFFQRFEGTQINKNTKRSVVMRTFERAGGTKTLFMKRFFNPILKICCLRCGTGAGYAVRAA